MKTINTIEINKEENKKTITIENKNKCFCICAGIVLVAVIVANMVLVGCCKKADEMAIIVCLIVNALILISNIICFTILHVKKLKLLSKVIDTEKETNSTDILIKAYKTITSVDKKDNK